MARLRGAYSGALFCQLERLFHHGTSTGLTEGELLERFIAKRDELAFEALVARHGRMVLGVCRQLLRDPNDVDDAFQATFLILVRKADTLRRCDLHRAVLALRSCRLTGGDARPAVVSPADGADFLHL